MVINRYLAELVGTFLFLSIGFLSIVAAGAAEVHPLLVAPFGFGFGLLGAIYAVGHVSGGHFNPAVTLAMFLDRRTSGSDLVGYWIAQIVGAVLASLVLLLATDQATVAGTATTYTDTGLAIIAEIVLTAAFVLVILASTKTSPATAGIAISLALVAVHFAGVPLSGASVNPARSFAPAVVGGSVTGLWLYLIVPLAGAALAWAGWRLFPPVVADTSTDLPEPGARRTV